MWRVLIDKVKILLQYHISEVIVLFIMFCEQVDSI